MLFDLFYRFCVGNIENEANLQKLSDDCVETKKKMCNGINFNRVQYKTVFLFYN